MNASDEAMNLILKGTRAFRVIDFPGRAPAKIAVRVLTEDELLGSRVDAQDRLRGIAKKRGWSDIVAAADVDPSLFDRLASRALVWRAFYDADSVENADKARRFFPTADDVASQDATVVTSLVDAYAEHVQLVTPLSGADEERVREVVEALGKGQHAEAMFSACDRPTLLRFALSSARALLSTSPTSK